MAMDALLTFFVVVSSLIGLNVEGCDVGLCDMPSCSTGQIDFRYYVSKIVLPFVCIQYPLQLMFIHIYINTHTHTSHSCLWPSSFSQAAVNGSSQTSGIMSSPIMGLSGMRSSGADSTSASSLETDTGTVDKHLMGKDRVNCPSTVSICLSLYRFHSLFPPRSLCPFFYLQYFSFTSMEHT